MDERSAVGRSLPKIDSLALAAGRELFTADYRLDDPLHCVLLYSPHAHADIVSIDARGALDTPGVALVLSFENVPRILHTTAGQGYPEPSPYDAVLFDRKVRHVGDRVALVAADTESIAREAAGRIRVEYKVLEPVLQERRSMDPSSARIHGDEEFARIPAAYDAKRNLSSELEFAFGDPSKDLSESAHLEDHEYLLHAVSHCAMEPHAAVAWLDARDRLVIVSATQVPFHARRIVGMVLGLPPSRIRLIKPRIGGGFGGKQEVILEPLAGLVALRARRPAKLVLSRQEVFASTRTRHEVRMRMRTGSDEEGRISALDLEVNLNSGAYAPHSLTVLSNAAAKVLPLFNKIGSIHFLGRSVYTNLPVGGAYRGYGAIQGYFALNQQIDMISRHAGADMAELCGRWHIREGETSPVFAAVGEGGEGVGQVVRSCGLAECIERGAREIGWAEKRGKKASAGADRVRGVGMAVAMQGSGIPKVDMAAASMKMNEDGSFNLLMGATDIGTGSDTILAQIAAEILHVPVDKIVVFSSDTDITPFDVGAYASSTTYVSGSAVARCARLVAGQILERAALLLNAEPAGLSIHRERAIAADGRSVGFNEIAVSALYGLEQRQIQAQASFVGDEAPPPFVAQFAEVEVDTRTGRVDVVSFVSAVDCGAPINPMLVEGQVEGAVAMGISSALWEQYTYDSAGRLTNPRFWDYRICGSRDLPRIRTIIVESHEPTGPFGAKSVGEVAINGPAPAIANAIFDAVGVRLLETPFLPEKVWRGLRAV